MCRNNAMLLRGLLLLFVFFGIYFSQAVVAQTQEIPKADFLKYRGKDEKGAFDRVIDALSKDQLLVVIFYSENCLFCKILFQQHTETFEEKDLNRKIIILNTDLFPDIASHTMNDNQIPESHYYFHGKKLSEAKGSYRSTEELIKTLRELQKASAM